jgi:hypothetical protein
MELRYNSRTSFSPTLILPNGALWRKSDKYKIRSIWRDNPRKIDFSKYLYVKYHVPQNGQYKKHTKLSPMRVIFGKIMGFSPSQWRVMWQLVPDTRRELTSWSGCNLDLQWYWWRYHRAVVFNLGYVITSYINQNATQESLEPWTSSVPELRCSLIIPLTGQNYINNW